MGTSASPSPSRCKLLGRIQLSKFIKRYNEDLYLSKFVNYILKKKIIYLRKKQRELQLQHSWEERKRGRRPRRRVQTPPRPRIWDHQITTLTRLPPFRGFTGSLLHLHRNPHPTSVSEGLDSKVPSLGGNPGLQSDWYDFWGALRKAPEWTWAIYGNKMRTGLTNVDRTLLSCYILLFSCL